MASFCHDNYVYNGVRTHIVAEKLINLYVTAVLPVSYAAVRPGS